MTLPMVNNQARSEEWEYAEWLRGVEQRAIIPLKWAILFVSLIIWLWNTDWLLPRPSVFLLFFLYMMFNIAQSYFFYFNRISRGQIKPFCYVSYIVDILFVTSLIYLETREQYANFQTDFYVFYFLLILRGFALFRSPRENIFISIVISVLFMFSIYIQPRTSPLLDARIIYFRFFMIWVVTFMSWFIVDIINRQKNELIDVRERLLRTEHLANVGELSASLAHEINNPMGIISAYSEFIMRKVPENSELREDLEVIVKEAHRCKGIVKELLDYSKPSMEQVDRCDLRTINDEVLLLIFSPDRKGLYTIDKSYTDNAAEIIGDCNQIKQSLVNVYMNARQAMPDGGRIKICISLNKSQDEHTVITISDEGPGIPRDLVNKVFDPFVTGREGGTGLGLYITRQIVEAHRGTIEIESKKDKGTTVRMLFPVA